jgi:multiple sugar transport system substrate-binding protein
VDWIWNQVADDQGVWAIPQDAGPMGNLYRTDIWQQAGLSGPPATWDEFAEQAQAIRTTGSYISNMPGNDPGQMVGLFWQAGAKPFGYDGQETVTVNLDSEDTQKVVSFWQELIQADLVSTDADFNDEWYQGLSRGKYASWQVAAWGPIFLQGTAANTSGLWQAAKLPQWQEGEDVSGNWGGSTSAVLSNTKNAIVAAEFAKFINTDREAALTFANEQFLFPTTTEILKDPDFTGLTSEFYGGQKVNEFFAGVSATVDPEFEWLPFMDFVYSSYNDTLGKAISDHGDMVGALSEWQSKVVDYAEQQGFTVE